MDASKSAAKSGSTHKESVFLNAKELPENQTCYFRAFPPTELQRKRWGGAVTVPQNRWFLKKGEKEYIVSISDTSLGKDRKDKVEQFLLSTGITDERGFEDGLFSECSSKAKQWRKLMAPDYGRGQELDAPQGLTPNRKGEFILRCVPVEKNYVEDGKKRKSRASGKPILLSFGFKVNDRILGEDMGFLCDNGMYPFFDIGPDGLDFWIKRDVKRQGKKETITYTAGMRHKTSILEDGEELLAECPCIIKEFERGYKPAEVIGFFAEEMDFDLEGTEWDPEAEEEEEGGKSSSKSSKDTKKKPAPKDDEDEGEEEEEEEDEDDDRASRSAAKAKKDIPSVEAATGGAKKKQPRVPLD